ncbi:uncharacterized protein [Dendropsophus ebraccatus]|uniref:uncharacterized protein n=1 Tax=Dendropsophus ebraccatus TaxID=150705 RepID=UPI0038315DD2
MEAGNGLLMPCLHICMKAAEKNIGVEVAVDDLHVLHAAALQWTVKVGLPMDRKDSGIQMPMGLGSYRPKPCPGSLISNCNLEPEERAPKKCFSFWRETRIYHRERDQDLPQRERPGFTTERETRIYHRERDQDLPQRETRIYHRERDQDLPQRETRIYHRERERPGFTTERETRIYHRERPGFTTERDQDLPQRERDQDLPQRERPGFTTERDQDLPQRERDQDLPQRERLQPSGKQQRVLQDRTDKYRLLHDCTHFLMCYKRHVMPGKMSKAPVRCMLTDFEKKLTAFYSIKDLYCIQLL